MLIYAPSTHEYSEKLSKIDLVKSRYINPRYENILPQFFFWTSRTFCLWLIYNYCGKIRRADFSWCVGSKYYHVRFFLLVLEINLSLCKIMCIKFECHSAFGQKIYWIEIHWNFRALIGIVLYEFSCQSWWSILLRFAKKPIHAPSWGKTCLSASHPWSKNVPRVPADCNLSNVSVTPTFFRQIN